MQESGSAQERSGQFVLLVADDEAATCDVCKSVAGSLALRVLTASTTEEALAQLERQQVDIVLADLRMPAVGGMSLLERIKTDHPAIEVILMTAYGTVGSAVQAMKLGAYDYLSKPFHTDELRVMLAHVVQRLDLVQENRILREQVRARPGFGGLVGSSPKMQRVYKLILKVSQSRYPVLIQGESGTGKELVARSIHYSGPQREKPFVPVDCAGLVPTLIESELFGYVKGAFTGALRAKQGLIEAAHGGTLFLDEIAELSVDLQAKLLRALQEREVKPVGSTERIAIDVRVVAASNRDLEATIREGRFRQDLYYRLNVVTLKLPSLRERKTDIPLLVSHFIERFAESVREIRGVSEEAMARLMSYDWPGNVRELENVIERAVALGSGPVIHTVDLPSNLQASPMPSPAPRPAEGIVPLRELEKHAILHAIEELGGDKLLAARLLGIGKTTLYRKIKEYKS